MVTSIWYNFEHVESRNGFSRCAALIPGAFIERCLIQANSGLERITRGVPMRNVFYNEMLVT